MNNERLLNTLQLFSMRNLLLESDLEKLESSGVAIDHIKNIEKDQLVDIEMFESDVIQSAKKMADFYVIYYAFENSIRRLIAERLSEKNGLNWWDSNVVPDGVKNNVKDKQNKEKDTLMSIRSDDPLTYTNFGELIDILNKNWADFTDLIRSQKAMQQVLGQFNLIRNIIAHSCELNEDEITRLKLLVKDWLRIQT
jgi:hypothetical protein